MTSPLAVAADRAARDLAAVDPDRVGAGPFGLLVVGLMILATVLLVRSMNAHLRRLPRDFPQEADEDGASGPETPRG